MFDALARLLVYDLAGVAEGTPLGDALHFFVMDVTKIFALLVGVIYAMGFLRTLLAPERVRDFLRGRSTSLARVLAISLGAVTPFCSCSSIPLFIGFVEAGIPLSVTFSFLIASPMINEVAVAVLVTAVGPRIAALYVVTGLVVAFVGGAIMGWFKPERWVADYVWSIQGRQQQVVEPDRSFAGRHEFAVGEVRSIVGRIWKWVLVGVAAGAAFHGFVPERWVTHYLADTSNLLAVPLAVLMGVPLYSNATGVVPLAEAMLHRGVPLGTVLALMMSIATLSAPEMLILRQVLHWRALALFASLLAVAFTLVGWGFNLLA